jgi:hypothetical protein
MKNFLIVTALAIGCTMMNKPTTKQTPVATEVLKPTEEITVHTPEVTITPRGQIKLTPALKYTVMIAGYDKYIPRVEKFFSILVNDNSVLDGRTFDYTKDSPDQIRKKILEGFDVKLVAFKPRWFDSLRWRKTIAYHEDWVIHFNSNKLVGRDDCSVINTLAHESTHAWGYGHGSDSPWNKDASFPYWVGNKAEEMCKEGLI